MQTIKRLLVAAASAALLCGVATASASAYAISGGNYTGTNTGSVTISVGGAYNIVCTDLTVSGAATGSATTAFTPAFGNCTFFGFPATITQSGAWSVTATGGPVGGVYTASLDIPAGSTTTIEVPIAGCTVTISGSQGFSGSTSTNNWGSGTGVDGEIDVTGLVYTASGCPFSSGSDGSYTGTISIPGITVS